MTTLRVGGPARRVVTAEREDDVLAVIRETAEAGEPLLVLGGGSNLVVSDDGFAGTVLRIATRGVAAEREGDRVRVTVAAGQRWDDFVAFAAIEGLAGVECLAGIPGLVGAVPMQNVGAYGQDVGQTIVRVRTWDRDAGAFVLWDRESCRFSYRNSVFRGNARHVVLDVTFELAASRSSGPLRYAELTKALGGDVAPLETVRSTVIGLRRKKGMVLDAADPDTASAGSFFTNPILDAAALAALKARVGDAALPTFPEADGRTKVSAAWLIERAGFPKGFAMGPVAISSKHALALTNRGGATTRDLVALARAVRDGVRSRFDVTLENEPVFVGIAL
jgi:UDP-N-acetylmuramate dehydrogenase